MIEKESKYRTGVYKSPNIQDYTISECLKHKQCLHGQILDQGELKRVAQGGAGCGEAGGGPAGKEAIRAGS